jgi:hypothetical protein
MMEVRCIALLCAAVYLNRRSVPADMVTSTAAEFEKYLLQGVAAAAEAPEQSHFNLDLDGVSNG